MPGLSKIGKTDGGERTPKRCVDTIARKGCPNAVNHTIDGIPATPLSSCPNDLVPDSSQFQRGKFVNESMTVEVSGAFQSRPVVFVMASLPESAFGVVEVGYRNLVEGDVLCPLEGKRRTGLAFGTDSCVLFPGFRRIVETKIMGLAVQRDNGVLFQFCVLGRSIQFGHVRTPLGENPYSKGFPAITIAKFQTYQTPLTLDFKAFPPFGARGFEPPTSCSQSRHASQTAPRPVPIQSF